MWSHVDGVGVLLVDGEVLSASRDVSINVKAVRELSFAGHLSQFQLDKS